MAIGRSIADLRGLIDLGNKQVLTTWKGMVVARSVPLRIVQPNSRAVIKNWGTIQKIAGRWFNVLTVLQRAKWEAYAKMLGSAYEQGKVIVSSGAKNIIPGRRGVLMGGVHAYTRSQSLASASEMTWPRDEAPLSTGIPPAPFDLNAHLDKDEDGSPIVVCELDPFHLEMFNEKKLRIWMKVQSQGMARNATLEHVMDVTGDHVKIAFKGFRAHKQWGREWVKFSELNGGQVLVQSDVVVSDSPKHGAIRSAGSAVGEVVLPTQDNTEAVEMTKHIKEYRRNIRRGIYYRDRAFKILADKLGRKLMAGENAGEAIVEILK